MRFALPIQLALLAVLGLTSSTLTLTPQPAQANQFDKGELDPSRFIIIASPIGTTDSYKLLIFEQLNNRRLCWQEIPGTPTTIDPLFMQFDFTKICGRSTDSNAYSVRAGDEDLAGRYNLRLVNQGNELVLVGFSLTDKNLRFFEIGRTRGMADGYIKVELDPGWRLTRRVFNGKSTGHLYFTTDRTLTDLANQAAPLPPTDPASTVPPATVTPLPSSPSGTEPSPTQLPTQPPTQLPQPVQPGAAPTNLPPVQNPGVAPVPTEPIAPPAPPSGSFPAAPSQPQPPNLNSTPQTPRSDVVIPVAPGETLPPLPQPGGSPQAPTNPPPNNTK